MTTPAANDRSAKALRCPDCQGAAPVAAPRCPECGASLIGLAGQVRAGHLLASRYRIERPLARGGMGAVYLAADTARDEALVAVKEMRIGGLGNTEALHRAIREFHREAEMLAHLSHPNLPAVFDQFADGGSEYLVMAYVPGETLAEVLRARGGPLDERQVRAWGAQLCALLGYLHSRTPPLIYRDLKPANIMLRPDGQLVLLDFGIARFYHADQPGDTAVFGTVGYAPPEQYSGHTDARSDLFSLGVLLHQLATGYNPLERPYRPLPAPRSVRPSLSPQLDAIIQRATAEDPAQRFPTAATFGAALAGRLRVAPPVAVPPRRRRSAAWLIAAIALLVVTLLGGSVAWSSGMLRATPTAPPATPGYVNNPTPAPAAEPIPDDLVLVPGGRWFMGDASDPAAVASSGEQSMPTFLIERTEVTNAQYATCVATGHCQPPHASGSATRPKYYDAPLFESYPVINVDWYQAQGYCRWRGRRLPTEAEWEKAARGAADQRRYPWGDTWTQSITTTDLLVNSWGGSAATRSQFADDTGRVGVRGAGVSPYGALDLIGNVGEWTASRDLPGLYRADDGREDQGAAGPRVVRGVPAGNDPARAQLTARSAADPLSWQGDRGFRCAASVEAPPSSAAAPPGMRGIRGGIALIGTSQAQSERWTAQFGWPSASAELNQTALTLGSFFLDQHEVTNTEYRRFVLATGHPTPTNTANPQDLNIWHGLSFPAALAQHPVVNVTWQDARSYCAWAGKRLPTEAEWEWAAKGSAGRLWPWGETYRGDELNTSEHQPRTNTAPVGSYPRGNTPEGLADLGGNVWEWTDSLSLPYPYNVFDGRENPNAEGPRIIRGGSWFDGYRSAHTTGREQLPPRFTNVNLGFRCAADQP